MQKFIGLSLILWILEGFCITMATDLALGLPHYFSVHIIPRSTVLPNFVEYRDMVHFILIMMSLPGPTKSAAIFDNPG